MTHFRHALFLLLALAPLAPAREPAPKRPLTLEDLWKVKRPGPPTLSPDGKWACVELTAYRMKENDSSSALWLLRTDGKAQRRLTTFKGKSSGPAWSPDGKLIAFTARRSADGPQVYLIAPDGGEARQLTKMPMAPGALKWSADGKALFCIARTWPDAPDDDAYRKKDKALKGDKAKAFIIDDALYRYWDAWLADGRRPVVFAIDATTGKHRNLFAGQKLHLPVTGASATSYDVSPDGKELCFVADSTPVPGTDFNLDLYALPLDKAGKPKNLTADNLANDAGPAYAPDGKSIAFTRQTTRFFYADRSRLMLLDRATGKARELTAKFDRSCGPPQWSPDSRRLTFEAEDKGYVRLFTVPVKGGKVAPLTAGFSDRGLCVSRDGRTLAFLRTSFGLPPAVFACASDGKGPR